MPFGFGKSFGKDKKVGRDPSKSHEKKERDRSESSRARADAYEQERKEKEIIEKKMQEAKRQNQEDKVKIKQLSGDVRAKSDQISELLTNVSEKTTENDELQSKIAELDATILKLETRISNDDHLIRIEPNYFEELKESVASSQKYESLLTTANASIARLESETSNALAAESANSARLRQELASALSARAERESQLQRNLAEIEAKLKTLDDENSLLTSNQKVLQQQLRATDDEKNVLESELKKSMKDNLSLESDLQKLQDELDRREKLDEMNGLLEKLTIVENQLRDAMVKNQEKDKLIMKKDELLEQKQNALYQMQNDMSERDNEIEKQRNIINDLRYKIKDDAERFESQFEETMMMHSRQLQSLRQSVDPNQVSRLESDSKRIKEQLRSEQDGNRQKTSQINELKTKCARLEARSRNTDEIEKYKSNIDELRLELKHEKSSRNEEKLNYETIVHNLRGHMLNIYAGNVSPEMAQVLNTALQMELRKQKKISN